MYDYLIVGAGLFGSVFAYKAGKAGKKVLVIDRRSHIGGNCYTEKQADIDVHLYGAHIFHTNNKEVWDFINQFADFNNYINSPLAKYKNDLYHLPFNMNTFREMWGIEKPHEAKSIIASQVKASGIHDPGNLEEQAISLVGNDIYQKLVKGYTEKQWGRQCSELPAFIIKRLPVRFRYDNNYFSDRYQGIPEQGYTRIFEKLLEAADLRLNTDFFDQKDECCSLAKTIVYTGMIDQFFEYCYGELAYRSLLFKHTTLNEENFQGNAVVNYTDSSVPYTRIIEHKHFTFGAQEKTVLTYEYPATWRRGDDPYYPINDETNASLFKRYRGLAEKEQNVLFGGRLADYRYYDMHHVIEKALEAAAKQGLS